MGWCYESICEEMRSVADLVAEEDFCCPAAYALTQRPLHSLSGLSQPAAHLICGTILCVCSQLCAQKQSLISRAPVPLHLSIKWLGQCLPLLSPSLSLFLLSSWDRRGISSQNQPVNHLSATQTPWQTLSPGAFISNLNTHRTVCACTKIKETNRGKGNITACGSDKQGIVLFCFFLKKKITKVWVKNG